MIAAFAQAGSERSASILGASEASIRTIVTLGRTKAGCEAGAPLDCIAPPVGTSISSDGACCDGKEGAGAARPALLTDAHAKTSAGAIAPHALFLPGTPSPICIVRCLRC